MTQAEGEHQGDRVELPRWAEDIKSAYVVYMMTMRESAKILGGPNTGRGELHRTFSDEVRSAYYDFHSQAKDDMPQWVPMGEVSPQTFPFQIAGAVIIGPPPMKLYYLSQSNEVYRVHSYDSIFHESTPERFYPEHPDFPGFDRVRSRQDSHMNVFFDQIGPQERTGELGLTDVRRILEGSAQTLIAAGREEELEDLLTKLDDLEVNYDNERAANIIELGRRVRRQLLGIRDAIVNRFGKHKLPGRILGNYSNELNVEDARRLCLITHTGELIAVPFEVKHTPVRKLHYERYDIDRAEEVMIGAWLNTSSIADAMLSRVHPALQRMIHEEALKLYRP